MPNHTPFNDHSNSLYLDAELRVLNPHRRDLPPEHGSRGFTPFCVRGIDPVSRTVEAVVSTPNLDRYDEVVEPEAFRRWLPNFMRNPILCAGHQYIGPAGEPTVIGHWTNLDITAEGLIGRAQFMTDDELAEKWWQRFRQGSVRAFSVGWMTHAYEMRTIEDRGQKRSLRVFTEVELLEISAVAIPANRESLVRAAAASMRRFDGENLSGDDASSGTSNRRQNKVAGRVFAKMIEQELQPGGLIERAIGDAIQKLVGTTEAKFYDDPDIDRFAAMGEPLDDDDAYAGVGDGDDDDDDLKSLFNA
jgi:HK97 family phage prohead protease